MKKVKGNLGYIKYKKTKQSIIVAIFIAAGLSLFFICRTVLGTSRNLGTVVAVLLTLPAAKAFVNLVLFVPYQSTDAGIAEKLSKEEKETDSRYYDLVFTSSQSVMHLDYLCVRGTELIALSENANKNDVIVKYFEESLSKRGINVHMHIFGKSDEVLVRLHTCNAEAEIPEEITEFIHTILV